MTCASFLTIIFKQIVEAMNSNVPRQRAACHDTRRETLRPCTDAKANRPGKVNGFARPTIFTSLPADADTGLAGPLVAVARDGATNKAGDSPVDTHDTCDADGRFATAREADTAAQ